MIESDMQVVLAMLLYFVVVVVIGFVYALSLIHICPRSHMKKIWSAYCFLIWHEQYFD